MCECISIYICACISLHVYLLARKWERRSQGRGCQEGREDTMWNKEGFWEGMDEEGSKRGTNEIKIWWHQM